MPSIYLIRHEEPEMRGRFIGRTNPPLSALGRDAAAAKLCGLDVIDRLNARAYRPNVLVAFLR